MNTAEVLLYDYPGSICSQMARLALEEKGVAYRRRKVDIMDRAEQFEPWYTALNPKAVVPTLVIGSEVVTDTNRIVHRIDRDFSGPRLTPADGVQAAAMEAMMTAIMDLHYGVLLYAKRRDETGKAPIVVARGKFLREQLEKYPERAEMLESRIAGNERLQAILADPDEIGKHVGTARELVGRMDEALAKTLFISADHYTLADTFATAALARFRLQGYGNWCSGGKNANVEDYYNRIKSRPSFEKAEVIDTGTERDL